MCASKLLGNHKDYSPPEAAQLFLVLDMDMTWLSVWLVVALCVQQQYWFCHTDDLDHLILYIFEGYKLSRNLKVHNNINFTYIHDGQLLGIMDAIKYESRLTRK